MDDASVVTRALGTGVLACFGVLVVSGVALMSLYGASPQSAWASTHYIQYVAPWGWVVRGMHFWAAQALLVFAAAHVLCGAWVGTYRAPRELVWWLTLAVVGLATAQALTGGLLPWDQRGWWARTVERNIAGLAPVVGAWLADAISAGPEFGAVGLARAYTLHIAVLPVALALVLVLRRRLRGSPIVAPAGGGLERAAFDVAIGAAVECVVLALAMWTHGAPLDAPADALADYPARPEWYLLPLYELRSLFHGGTEFWAITTVAIGSASYFAFLPWIDRPGRSRQVALAPAGLIFAGACGLALMAWAHDRRDPAYVRARRSADARASAVIQLAMNGVPPGGALELVRRDPDLRGRDLFERYCATCHSLGDLGQADEGSGPKLDGWGTPQWIEAMLHDPDATEFFGRSPYKGKMPSTDTRPARRAFGWAPMTKSPQEMHAVAVFLSAQGDEAGERSFGADAADLALGEKIVRERCSDCHPYEGEGDVANTRMSPELSRYGSIEWTLQQLRNPGSEKTYRAMALEPSLKHHMPRFDTELSADDLGLLARWTRARARGLTRL